MIQPKTLILLRLAMAAVVLLGAGVGVAPAQVPTDDGRGGRATHQVVIKVPGMT